jgi:hypothetical protein
MVHLTATYVSSPIAISASVLYDLFFIDGRERIYLEVKIAYS